MRLYSGPVGGNDAPASFARVLNTTKKKLKRSEGEEEEEKEEVKVLSVCLYVYSLPTASTYLFAAL